ncbi:hypothetical protein [Rhodococcus erythropolis]|uniref:hypothetical protein n=1 Tax=Rhodococcus erythropolis TaxID=1833 RepID=UPI000878AF72|nr:hypothetical protein [Rhodococcus erythropolis]
MTRPAPRLSWLKEDRAPLRELPSGPEGAARWTLEGSLTLVLTAFVPAGSDPITVTFSWLLSLGTVALITIMTFAAISVIAFVARTKVETNVWNTGIVFGCTAEGFAVIAYLALPNYGVLLGGHGGTPHWLLLLIPAFAALGSAGRRFVHPSTSKPSSSDTRPSHQPVQRRIIIFSASIFHETDSKRVHHDDHLRRSAHRQLRYARSGHRRSCDR